MNRKTALSIFLLATAVFILTACSGTAATPTSTAETGNDTQDTQPTATPEPTALTKPSYGLAPVESVEVLTLESFPVQINVQVQGELPNDCTKIDDILTQAEGNHFDVAITTVQQPGEACTAAAVPFAEMVPLDVDDLDAGTYTVTVNGIKGSFTLAADNRLPDEETAAEVTAEAPTVTETAVINGLVWHDLCTPPTTADTEAVGCVETEEGSFQANGILDSGEPGIAEITLNLGEGDCPATGIATTVTKNDGSYTFTDLTAGKYCVSIDTLGADNQAILIPGSWTYPDSGISETAVTLAEGETSEPVDFGWDYEFRPLPEETSACENNSFAYIRDLNIPDNTTFTPGAEFTKRWEIQNNSDCVWTTDYSIAFVGGEQMSAPDNIPLEKPVAPGETIEIAINMVAPEFRQDPYRGNWQIADPSGEPFGINGMLEDAFWLQIQVREGVAPQATVAPDSAVIGGVVWDDYCNSADPGRGCWEFPEDSGNWIADGTLDNEPRLEGITMSLASGVCTSGQFPSANTVITTAVTDEFGLYRFENLSAGSYCVFMDALSSENVNYLIPGNWTWPAAGVGQLTVVLIEGEQALDIDFGWDYQE